MKKGGGGVEIAMYTKQLYSVKSRNSCLPPYQGP